jgi:hypothetical protein
VTLATDVIHMRQQIKHTPDSVDLDDVRQLLARVEDALDVLLAITSGADMSFYCASDGEGWHVTINADLDDRRPLMRWIAGDV